MCAHLSVLAELSAVSLTTAQATTLRLALYPDLAPA
jgi:hypothetical protein